MSKLVPLAAPFFRFDRPPPVAEWCEGNLVIPRKMSPGAPGKLSLSSRPWARPILETWHPESGVRSCTVAVAVQMAKTTMMVLGSSYRMVHGPVPQMLVGGMSEKFARRELSEKRLHPLINGNEVLSRLKPHDRNLFRNLEMQMAYAPVLVTGAGSDTNLAGSTQGIVAIDECAKIEHHGIQGETAEAHPIRLAEDRTKDFLGQEFRWKSSTPNTVNHVFWQDVLAGTFTHFWFPCPHCGEWFAWEFESRRSDDEWLTPGELGETAGEARPDIYRSVVWSPDARNADGTWDEGKVKESAHYVCPSNGCRITDAERLGMLDLFEEKHHNEKASMANRSFRAPSFLSPRRRFGDLAWAFLQRGDLFSTGLQVFFNHELALPWEDIDVRVKDEAIWECCAEGEIAYTRGTVPKAEGMLFAGADWGQNEVHWVVGLIDRGGNIWVVDWGTVLGLTDLLRERTEWRYARAAAPDRPMRPMAGMVDSGDNTIEVYQMCQRSAGFWWPAKGSGAESGHWNMTRLDKYRPLSLYTYVDKVAKDDLYEARIFRKRGRRLWLPSDADAELVAGLSGQQRNDKGVRAKWKKVKDDHYGDAIKLILLQSWVFSDERKPGDGD